MTWSILLYLLGFAGMWLGAGLALSPISRLSRVLHISAFNLSFFILGIATSISELSVGINSVLKSDPEIYVGNLIGASLILFLLVIPVLAVMGNKITVDKQLRGSNLALVLGVIALPAMLSFDGIITHTDAGIALAAYPFLFLFIQTRQNIFEKLTQPVLSCKIITKLVLLILFGVTIIFGSSRLVVQETIYFASILGLSPFILSLFIISLGTNLPEIALGVRSLVLGKKSLAFGDYVGSAAFNTFLFGALSLATPGPIFLTNSYWVPLLTTLVGLIFFFQFAKTKDTISRREAAFLLLIYIGFLTAEVLK